MNFQFIPRCINSIGLAMGILAMIALPSYSFAENYKLDNTKSSINFETDTDGTFEIIGQFPKNVGQLFFDNDDFGKSSILVTIDAGAVTASNEFVQSVVRSKGLFDVENHPTITFKSIKVDKTGATSAEVVGELTIKNIAKEVIMLVELSDKAEDMSKLTFSGIVVISRSGFNMDAWPNAVSDIVTVTINAVFNKE